MKPHDLNEKELAQMRYEQLISESEQRKKQEQETQIKITLYSVFGMLFIAITFFCILLMLIIK